ncbi:MAG: hypothetical protein K8S16_22110, partial [Bacteroidales bacterium]|nr:hypothetical protein [Bacteroidales bacterium]
SQDMGKTWEIIFEKNIEEDNQKKYGDYIKPLGIVTDKDKKNFFITISRGLYKTDDYGTNWKLCY